MEHQADMSELQQKLYALRASGLKIDDLWHKVDTLAMSYALQIAEKSDLQRTKCKIGAIILDNQTLNILGWSAKGLFDHAEAQAIAMAGAKMKGRHCTLYTTLEPCVYRTVEGKPTCSSLIAQHPEIKRVVIKNLDSDDQKNFKQGLAFLRANTDKQIDLIECNT